VRIFSAYQHFNWEDHNLGPALDSFGEHVHYDWHKGERRYDQYDAGWHFGGKQAMNGEMLARVLAAHREAPLDVFYGYLCGRLVFRGCIEWLRMLGVPTLTMCLDDKTHRYSALEPTGFAGMIDVASAFDLCWTNDPTAVAWYESIGARAIYLPPGANPDVFVPRECERDIPVLFVGKNYGRRAEIIGQLAEAGIDVTCYGQGWPRGPVSTAEMVNLMNRAQITLGIGETGDPALLSLKGRDFEAPMAGAFYLVQDNPELWAHYNNNEISTWHEAPDLVGCIRHYQAHPGITEAVRHNAAIRARRDHTWRRRFEAAFTAMGLTWG
jgi:hypothetical protein